MAFVAQGVIARALRLTVGGHKIALENRAENGAMRTVRARAAGVRTGITVMTIGAIHHAADRPRRDEARHARLIFTDGFNGMKTLIRGGKGEAQVGLRNLP